MAPPTAAPSPVPGTTWPPFDAKKTVLMPWSEPQEIRYDTKDVLLYNLGVGCSDLRFVYEKSPDFSVFPTFPIRYGGVGAWDRFPRTTPGLNIDGERYMELFRPLPPPGRNRQARVFASARVFGFHDKGSTPAGRHKGALVEFETRITDAEGNPICRLVNGEFYRGIKELGDIGAFEGAGETCSQSIGVPARGPDMALQLPIPNNAAHLYRLSGDYLPHHIDPAAAKRVGYDRVILHGLASLGYVTGVLLSSLCGNEVQRFRRIKMRFSAPVYMGEQLTVEVWNDGPGRVLFQARARERNELCVSNAYFEYAPAEEAGARRMGDLPQAKL
uniref:MaoC-like domain-containing protein n=1 Tax=Alexandrium monilatum TaxID=311494 RepID=A0A7S4QT96_9DINO|mmetsp:Transcript_27680/g.82628  ORF Transcript_27680/g.82628 Transcript_27680/m.82628 type:complete len:330 (+) Transcript_27680:188-1177(+)